MVTFTKVKNSIDSLLKNFPKRNEDIIRSRFGLGKEKNTLEKIGKVYGITRERVRQIENKNLSDIRHSSKFHLLQKEAGKIEEYLKGLGGLKREDILIRDLSPEEESDGYVLFLLTITDLFDYSPSSDVFYPFWMVDRKSPDVAQFINDSIKSILEKERSLLTEEEIINLVLSSISSKIKIKIQPVHIISFIEISKYIELNPFGRYGLVFWPEVTPKTIRDKAYLVLYEKKQPMHFTEIKNSIQEILGESIKENTLHNELIRDSNFVLIGRGIYALKNWGYKKGILRDVIGSILKEGGPLTKEELYQEIKKQRMVKDSTITLNIYSFKKDKDGRYYI